MIKCEVCGKEFKAINKRHLAHHNLSKEQYLELFPNAKFQSEESANKRKLAAKQRIENMSDEKRSEISRQAAATRISRGFTSWNDGKGGYNLEWSEEAKARSKERGAWNKGVSPSVEQKAKQSETLTNRYSSGEIIHWNTGKTTSEETKQKISEGCRGYKLTEIQREKFILGIQRYISSPDYVPGMLNKNHSEAARKNISKGVKRNYHKVRKTMEDNGHWVPLSEVPAFTTYKREVWRFTSEVLHLIPGYDQSKRGLNSKTENNYQVDHNFSIYDGFKNEVDPKIVGHVANLSFIPWRENNRKWHKSSITIEELLLLIDSHK